MVFRHQLCTSPLNTNADAAIMFRRWPAMWFLFMAAALAAWLGSAPPPACLCFILSPLGLFIFYGHSFLTMPFAPFWRTATTRCPSDQLHRSSPDEPRFKSRQSRCYHYQHFAMKLLDDVALKMACIFRHNNAQDDAGPDDCRRSRQRGILPFTPCTLPRHHHAAAAMLSFISLGRDATCIASRRPLTAIGDSARRGGDFAGDFCFMCAARISRHFPDTPGMLRR